MEIHQNDNQGLKRVARRARVNEIRRRCQILINRTDSTASWDQAERDRWDLVRLYEIALEELSDASTEITVLRRAMGQVDTDPMDKELLQAPNLLRQPRG